MHKKFKEKLALDDLLNEMENVKQEISGIYDSCCLIENYIKNNDNIEKIKNMSYLVNCFKNNLFCILKEMDNIVNKEKYNHEDYIVQVKNNLEYVDIKFDD